MNNLEINPSDEYDALRQEILKRIEIHFMILNLNLTVSGVLLGFGVSNNLIAMILPPTVLFLVVTMKNNSFGYLKIGDYLSKNYTITGGIMNWETFNDRFESSRTMKVRRKMLGLGSLGVFITAPVIAVTIGIINYKATMVEKFLIAVDIFSIIGIILLFILLSTHQIKKMLSKEGQKELEE